MRFLFRFLSMVALVLAVIAGAIDAIQSVSAADMALTSLGSAWQDLSPSTLAALETFVTGRIDARLWDPVMLWVLAQPTFAVFLVLALLFWVLGYKRDRPAGRFAA